MSLFSWLRKPGASPAPALQARLERLPLPQPPARHSLRQQRWVVVDLETSGLNVNRDQVLSIGAVVIEDGAIDFSQQFERTLQNRQHKPGPSVLLHGLGPSAIAAGSDPAQALVEFLEFTADSPLLAFHAPFDQRMLTRALKDHLNHNLQHSFYDVAEMAPLLCPQVTLREAGLDDWINHFGLEIQARHHASADALVTAELALILFSHARRMGLDSPEALDQQLRQWRRRQQIHGF